ncbi:MAG: DUF4836 family protein [Saprospiraceae bacterium]
MIHSNFPVPCQQSWKNTFYQKTPLAILFLLPAFVAVGQTALKYVPANAEMVLTVNLPNLEKKVNLEQLKHYDFYQSLMKEIYQSGGMEGKENEKAYYEELINHPANLGFDLSEPFYIYLKKQGDNLHFTAVWKLSDKQKYEQGLQQLKADGYQPNLEEKEGFQLWQSNDETFAWNDEVVVNVWTQKQASPYDGWGVTEGPYDWGDEGEEDVVIDDEVLDENVPDEAVQEDPLGETVSPADDEAFLQEMGMATKDTSAAVWAGIVMGRQFLQPMSRNERFMEAISLPSDLHFWLDYDFFFSEAMKDMNTAGQGMGRGMDAYLGAMATFMDVFYADTYLSMGVNFENGKMAMSNQLFFNEDMRRFYQQVFKVKFNRKFLRYVKGGDQLFGYFYFNYNVKNTIEEGKSLLYKIFEATPQYGDMARDVMQILGIVIDEDAIGKLVKGDFMVSVSGIQSVEVTQKIYDYDADFNFIEKDTTMLQEMPVFTALASYGSEKDIMKFVNLGIHSEVLKKEGRYYRATIPDMGTDLFLALQNGVLILTNNQYLVTQNLDKGVDKKLRLPKKHRKMLCDNATAFYWDIPNTIRAAAGDQADANVGTMGYLNMLGKQFESLEMTYSKKVGNSMKGKIDFNFIKKDKNALQLFFNFVNDIFLEMEGGAKT